MTMLLSSWNITTDALSLSWANQHYITQTPYFRIDTMYNHNIAVNTSGNVFAWGENSYGETTVPVGLTNVVQVAIGKEFAYALKSDGTLQGWGRNNHGQLDTPAELTTTTVLRIAAGDDFMAAIKGDGTVICWGNNDSSQCNVPSGLKDVVEISCGKWYSYALTASGSLATWGSTYTTPGGLENNVAYIDAGCTTPMAVTKTGALVVWGDDSNGLVTGAPALSSGVASVASGTYVAYILKTDGSLQAWGSTYQGANLVPTINNGVAVRAGDYHGYVLKSDGSLQAWGNGNYGQRATPAITLDASTVTPTPPTITDYEIFQDNTSVQTVTYGTNDFSVSGLNANQQYEYYINALNGTTIVDTSNHVTPTTLIEESIILRMSSNNVTTASIDLSWKPSSDVPVTPDFRFDVRKNSNIALDSTGTINTWGYTFPFPTNLTNVKQVAVGFDIGMALKRDGTLSLWGLNNYGQLNVPAAAAEIGFVKVAPGPTYSTAITTEGVVVAWGNLGSYPIPTQLTDGSNVIVDIGYNWGLTESGTVYMWGEDFGGETIVPSGLNNNVAAIGNQGGNTIALTKTGGVVVWGSDIYGLVSNAPVLSDAIGVGLTSEAAFAIKADRSVVAWGSDAHGLLTLPAELTDVIAIKGGITHAIALRSDGKLIGWGNNGTYQKLAIPNITVDTNTINVIPLTEISNYQISQNNIPIQTVSNITSSYTASSLDDNKYYKYDINALDVNSNIIATGNELTELTLPDAPMSLQSTAITTSSLTLSWNAYATGVDYGALSYDVYNGENLLNSVTTNSIDLTGLSAGTEYNLKVNATNDSGTSTFSDILITQTLATAPINLVGSNFSATGLTLTWDAVTGADSYEIFDSTTSLDTSITNAVVLTSLTPATFYQLNVKAINTAGASDASTSLNVTLIATPTNLSSSLITSSGFSLSWDNVAGADSYEVYEGANLLESPSTNSVTISSLTPNTTYDITVKAVNTTMTTDASSILQVTTLQIAPTTPTNFTAMNISHDKLTLTWDAVVSADAYEVYKDTNLIDGNVAGTSFLMDGLNAETTYNFAVKSKNGIGTSAEATTTATTLAVGTSSKRVTLLTPIDNATDIGLTPTLTWDLSTASPGTLNITYTTGNTTEATLSWAAVTDAVSYNLYLNDALVTNIAATSTSYKFINILTTVGNDLGVSAVNVNGTESLISYKTTYYTGS